LATLGSSQHRQRDGGGIFLALRRKCTAVHPLSDQVLNHGSSQKIRIFGSLHCACSRRHIVTIRQYFRRVKAPLVPFHTSQRLQLLYVCVLGKAYRSEERRVGKERRSRWA